MEDCNLRQTGIVKLSEWEGHTFVEPTLPLAFFSLPSHRESRPIAIGKLKLRSLLRFRPGSRRRLLASGFVLEPWELDPIFQNSDRDALTPSIEMIHAYFPGISKAADVKIDHPSADGEVVVCTLDGPVPSARLKISDHGKEPLGMALTYLGYPGGVDLLAAMAPEDLKEQIYRYGTPSADEVAGILAEHGYIQPI